ncbi:unnamed protein product [Oncorhynchus mykiss]|uniref:Uncharacterized protein n=1 Tax=Oncorhynchus mykiss TaxID=8022 RepID=A0A060ZA68_ONCMY|nr:unnamed protein product [Oncorhynchus mykiss]
MAQTTPTVPPPASIISKAKTATPDSGSDDSGKKPPSSLGPRLSAKRRAAADEFQSPRKKPSPPVKSQSVRPNMRSFLHTVQKNQMLMMTPSSLGRNTVMKSFIKHTTPGRADLKSGCGVVVCIIVLWCGMWWGGCLCALTGTCHLSSFPPTPPELTLGSKGAQRLGLL